jgi:adenosylhomocysteine nucleosidase
VRRALRRRGDIAGIEVLVTGMGQQAAAAAAGAVPRVSAVVVCGLAGGCGGLAHRGDVVVASRLIDAAGAVLPGVVGVDVIGTMALPVASVDRVVDDPADRAALLALGAEAVETEGAAWACAAARAGVPVAVVRGVLDTPEDPLGIAASLVRPGATAPAVRDTARLVLRPGAWPALLRLGRTAGATERRVAEAAVRVAEALRASG